MALEFRDRCFPRLLLRQPKIPELEQRLGVIYGLTIKHSSKDKLLSDRLCSAPSHPNI